MDAGTMKDYIEDLIQQSNAAAQVMEQASDEIKRLRAERDKWRFHAEDLYRALMVQTGIEFETQTAKGAKQRYEATQ